MTNPEYLLEAYEEEFEDIAATKLSELTMEEFFYLYHRYKKVRHKIQVLETEIEDLKTPDTPHPHINDDE